MPGCTALSLGSAEENTRIHDLQPCDTCQLVARFLTLKGMQISAVSRQVTTPFQENQFLQVSEHFERKTSNRSKSSAVFSYMLALNELALAYFKDLHHCRPKIG